MEELSFGDSDHQWVRPGHLFTKGPGTYKIPAFDDTPVDFRVRLLDGVSNPFAVHSSKAIGEPPFFLAASAFFAAKAAAEAARAEARAEARADADSSAASAAGAGADGGESKPEMAGYFSLFAPATSERLRMACTDAFSAAATVGNPDFRTKGSY